MKKEILHMCLKKSHELLEQINELNYASFELEDFKNSFITEFQDLADVATFLKNPLLNVHMNLILEYFARAKEIEESDKHFILNPLLRAIALLENLYFDLL